MTGLLAALGAALAWGGLDAVRKGLADRMTPVAVVAVMTAGQGVLFVIWTLAEGRFVDGSAYLVAGSTCLALNVAANVLFVESVRVSPLSVTVPFLALSPVFAAVSGIWLVGEVPSAEQWVGIVAVVLGAMVINAGDARGLRDVVTSVTREPGSVMMIGVALMWAITVSLDKLAMRHASPAGHGAVQTVGVCVVTAAYLLARRRGAEIGAARGAVGLMTSAVLLGALALGLQLLAVQTVMVGVVETVKRAVGLALALAVGRLAFAESINGAKVVALVLMAVGSGLVALG